MKKLLARLTSSSFDPSRMRLKQWILVGGVVVAGIVIGRLLLTASSPVFQEEKKEERKETAKLNTPFEAVNPRDVWVNRVQEETEKAHNEVKAVRDENKLLLGRLEMMEKALQSLTSFSSSPERKNQEPLTLPKDFPKGGREKAASLTPPDIPSSEGTSLPQTLSKSEDALFNSSPSRIHHASLDEGTPEGRKALLKNINNTVPAGSYVRAVLTSGVVASTALHASSQPQPIVMRLVNDGKLPRGFQSAMKDNVLIGACYGDLSSERVMCRLETMSWVDEEGLTIEKKVEGWIIGEDGRPGLRGEVVDRSSDAVRNSMLAGILSGFSGFFKNEATSSVYPVTPFGQTNALKGQQALKGAAGTGMSNALDKLAEFSIKRAEQMQPVILIASGRVVDVVFKTGVDIRPEMAAPSLVMIHQKQMMNHQEKENAEF